MASLRNRLKLSPTGIALVAANCVPIIGIVFLEWELFPLVFLYWLENAVIGGFNVLKMVVNRSREPWKLGQKLLMIPFFWIHYGGFLMAHGFVVLDLFGGPRDGIEMPTLAEVLHLVSLHGLTYALLAIALSHAVSFAVNYIRRGEWRDLLLVELMFAPYGRVVVLHLFIIGSGFILQYLGAPRLTLVLLAVLKTVADLIAHNRAHDPRMSRLKRRMRRLYESAAPRPSGGADPMASRYPGYRYDLSAQRRRGLSCRIGCGASLLLLAAGIVLACLSRRPAARWTLGAGVVVGVLATVVYNVRKGARCSGCGETMEAVDVDCPPEELSPWVRLVCHVGPDGETYVRSEDESGVAVSRILRRWFVCHRCRTYFLGRKHVTQTVARDTESVQELLCRATELIDDDGEHDA
jgi:hypothetical protein